MTELIRGTRYVKKNLIKNKFSLVFNKAREFSLNIQKTAVPGVTYPAVQVDTPFIDRPIYGTKPVYEDLIVEFVVDDVFNTWGMIYDWMRAFTPKDMTFDESEDLRTEFDSYRKDLPDVYDIPNLGTIDPDGTLYDNPTLIINNSSNIPEMHINFIALFPSGLSSIPLDISAESDEIAICTASFKYWYYTLERKGEI